MHLLIGSTTPCSGKTAMALGLGLYLRTQGWQVGYAKPLGSVAAAAGGSRPHDEDCLLMSAFLDADVSTEPPLVFLDRSSVRRRLLGEDNVDYVARLRAYRVEGAGQVRLIEGAGSPEEGALFGLPLQVLAEQLPARVLLVCPYRQDLAIDQLLTLRAQLGNRLMGIVLNTVPAEQVQEVNEIVVPFLERQGIAVCGVLPADTTLHSLSVADLVRTLGAEVLCCRDRLERMVESFNIGAMSVNAARKYFRTNRNKVVLTGGDRTDIQLAALETSTACLVLTGHLLPSPLTLQRAEELEVPVLSVNLDTLQTTKLIERCFGQARFRGAVKVQRIQQLLDQHFQFARFQELVGLPQGV